MGNNNYINFDNIKKAFPAGKISEEVVVLTGFNFVVQKGEFITFFGPNACGKSTLLNIVAGLLEPDSGTLQINGKPPKESKIGFVFQNYQNSLLPWRTNIENIALSLELDGIDKKRRFQIAENFMYQFEINVPKDGYPYQLSGGQQQLLCIARALISGPDVLLMDEPFNQLDLQARIDMNNKVQDMWIKTGKTILFVSHDLEEAIVLADRIVILTKRPARIAGIIDNPLPRPRKSKVLQGEDFFRLKREALKIFEDVLKV